ncbi:MAG: hypothetical protein M0Z28_06920 [Rhodospirillales bacterium]|nr:hypothetical protein [Rhodospirillales bacterium]
MQLVPAVGEADQNSDFWVFADTLVQSGHRTAAVLAVHQYVMLPVSADSIRAAFDPDANQSHYVAHAIDALLDSFDALPSAPSITVGPSKGMVVK